MNYYIGMFNNFDNIKFERDYTKNISGIEFCNFENFDDIRDAVKLCNIADAKIGIHFPLFKGSYKHRDPLLTHKNIDERKLAFEAVEKEIAFAKQINAEYILMHFPKPFVLDRKLDWSLICMGDWDATFEDKITEEEFKFACEEAMGNLSTLSSKYNVNIVLELEFLHKWIYKNDFFKNLLIKYDNLKLCLDSARLHIMDTVDPDFNLNSFLEEYSPFTSNIHLSNTQVSDVLSNRHYPVLPNLSKKDGWCDINAFLNSIKPSQKLNVLFEHKSNLIDENQLYEVYDWVMNKL